MPFDRTARRAQATTAAAPQPRLGQPRPVVAPAADRLWPFAQVNL